VRNTPKGKNRSPHAKQVNFKPDKVYRPSFTLLEAVQTDDVQGTAKEKLHSIQMDPHLRDLAQQQIMARLKSVQILNWNSPKLRLTGNKKSDIYVITTIVDDYSKDPVTCELNSFSNINKGDRLTIASEFGVKMFQCSGRIPTYLDIRILVVRSKKGIRDLGQALASIRGDSDFKDTVQKLASLVTGPIGIVTAQIEQIVGVIGKILQLKKDDQLCYYCATITRDFDNLAIGKEICDGNALVRFCYKIEAGSVLDTLIAD
jgi:hypothetical protein